MPTSFNRLSTSLALLQLLALPLVLSPGCSSSSSTGWRDKSASAPALPAWLQHRKAAAEAEQAQQWDVAEKEYDNALAVAMRMGDLGLAHGYTYTSTSDLSRFYCSRGKAAQARYICEANLEITRSAMGPRSFWVGALLVELGLTYSAEKGWATAQSHFLAARKIADANFSPYSRPYTFFILPLADNYLAQKQFNEAKALYLQALDIAKVPVRSSEMTADPRYMRIITEMPDQKAMDIALAGLTEISLERNDMLQAEKYASQRVELIQGASDSTDKDRIRALARLGQVEWLQKKGVVARSHLQEALDLAGKQRNPDAQVISTLHSTLGSISNPALPR